MNELEASQRRNFLNHANVSRETMERLDHLVAKTRKWSTSVNLISKATLGTIWQRHVADSAQLFEVTNRDSGKWLDIGSGAGYPGLVIGILASEHADSFQVTLVESDKRKCVFLRTTIHELGIEVDVRNTRVEMLEPQVAMTVSARALAPLPRLLELATPHLATGGICLFPKGQNHQSELTDAKRCWKLSYDILESRTDPQARILRIHEAIRV